MQTGTSRTEAATNGEGRIEGVLVEDLDARQVHED
jgi:hypothetical protein